MNKDKINLTIVSYSYPPANAPAAQRPFALAKFINKDKFSVDVITCANQDSSLGFDKNAEVEVESVQLHKIKALLNTGGMREVKKSTMQGGKAGIKVKIKQWLMALSAAFLFPDRAVIWLPPVMAFALKSRKRLSPDVIFSTSPLFTNHYAARFLKLFHPKAMHIADFRDFHYIHNYELKKGFKSWLHKLAEKRTINKADKVVVISNSMKDIYASKYPSKKEKIFSVYNGYDDNPYAGQYQLDDKKLVIFYAGSFYGGIRSPNPLLYTLEELVKSGFTSPDEIRIEIAGNIEQTLVEEVKSLQVFSSIVFLGLISRNEVLKKYCQSHLLWLIVGNEINHYTGVPIKMFEYLASRRYILNFSPEAAESRLIINQAKAGWNMDNTENSEKNITALKDVISKFREGKLNEMTDLSLVAAFEKTNQIKIMEGLMEC
jgi:glycosyltransferase involved in cell wall biosynthesis